MNLSDDPRLAFASQANHDLAAALERTEEINRELRLKLRRQRAELRRLNQAHINKNYQALKQEQVLQGMEKLLGFLGVQVVTVSPQSGQLKITEVDPEQQSMDQLYAELAKLTELEPDDSIPF